MKKKIFAVLVASFFCVPVMTAHADKLVTKKEGGKFGDPKSGMALVYFVRPAKVGGAVKTFGFVDDEVVGITKGRSYFYTDVKPGKHLFWLKMENISSGYMTVEAEKSYCLKNQLSPGFLKATVKVVSKPMSECKTWISEGASLTEITADGESKGKEMVADHYSSAKEQAEERL